MVPSRRVSAVNRDDTTVFGVLAMTLSSVLMSVRLTSTQPDAPSAASRAMGRSFIDTGDKRS
jgi:hypothetical protein